MSAHALAGVEPPWALVGVRVWDGTGAVHAAVGFGRDGRVTRCGDAATVLASLPPRSTVVDGAGAFVCPGFVDPHVHVRAAASAAAATPVPPGGRRELLTAIEAACRSPRPWATLIGLRVDGDELPTRDELDHASNGACVRVRDDTGHAWLLNSRALLAVGIDPNHGVDAPTGVLVDCDRGGRPTGLVVDHVGWVGARLGRVTPACTLSNAVTEWSGALARAGVAALCDATATNGPEEARSLLHWQQTGVLQQATNLLVAPDAEIDARDPAAGMVRGVKFADAHDPRLVAFLRRRAAGAVAVHCVEPDETGAVLDAAAAARPVPGTLRIEHASYVPPDWIADVRRVGATVVTQPAFVAARGDRYLDDPLLAPHTWLYRLASWRAAGVPLAFASDAPFGPASPLDALEAAASRRTGSGRALGPDEALAGEAALRAVTTTAAAAAGVDRHGYGRLTPGGPGAAVVLTHDVRAPERAGEIELIGSVIGGAVVG